MFVLRWRKKFNWPERRRVIFISNVRGVRYYDLRRWVITFRRIITLHVKIIFKLESRLFGVEGLVISRINLFCRPYKWRELWNQEKPTNKVTRHFSPRPAGCGRRRFSLTRSRCCWFCWHKPVFRSAKRIKQTPPLLFSHYFCACACVPIK